MTGQKRHGNIELMRTRELNVSLIRELRGKRSREVIAHELRKRGHGTDAKAIWRYETGRSQPNARILPDYADVLGAKKVDDLYSADDDDDEESRGMADISLDDFLRARIELLVREVVRA